MMAISDVMSGLMFIFIITLAIFVFDFIEASREHEEEMHKLTEALNKLGENNQMRASLLVDIQDELKKREIDVEIDAEHGVLRLNENAIRFETGSSDLNEIQIERLGTVAEVLGTILPCYGINPPEHLNCLKDKTEGGDESKLATAGKIDSIFVEGHTDNVPIGGRLAQKYQDNWVLSAHRAMFTYREVAKTQPVLAQMMNNNNQPIISVSGYGEGRPVPGHEYNTPVSDPVNRRIDFRFIMTPPSITEAQASMKGNLN